MKPYILRAVMAFSLTLVATPIFAQMSQYHPEVSSELRGLGSTHSEIVPRTNALFGALRENMDTSGVVVRADVSYGEHERNKLDLYLPEEKVEDAPILIFAHGGGYVRGDKDTVVNVGYYFAQHGIVVATINYRLAPDATWPAGAEDFEAAVQWFLDYPDAHSGDIRKIFVSGTSAGAGHAGSYLFNSEGIGAGQGVAGGVLLASPSIDLAGELDPTRDALYFGTDADQLGTRSIINNLHTTAVPLLLAVAEFDLPTVQDQNFRFIEALYRKEGELPNFVTVLNHNHYSIAQHIGTGDNLLSDVIREFIAVNGGGF